MGLRGDQEISRKMFLKCNEGCGEGRRMAARREIRYIGLNQRVSCLCAWDRLQICHLQLCCDVLLAVPEHEKYDELEAVANPREKTRPQPRGSHNYPAQVFNSTL